MKIDVYTEFGEDIEKLWTEFEQKVIMTPFQSFAWLSHWQTTVGDPLFSIQQQIVHIQENEQTLAIMPMGIRKRFGINILEWLGGINTDYMGPLIHSKYLIDSDNKGLWNSIKSKIEKYDVIHFQKQSQWTVQFLERIGFSNSSKKNLKEYTTFL